MYYTSEPNEPATGVTLANLMNQQQVLEFLSPLSMYYTSEPNEPATGVTLANLMNQQQVLEFPSPL